MIRTIAVLLIAAALCGCAAGIAVTGPATPPSTAGIVSLSTDIDVYSPLMSSAFGIHILAEDGNGNPVKGNWTATWGQFCTAEQVSEGSWKVGDAKETWEDASDIWWQFSSKPNPNGEMPSAVSVYFSGGGMTQTLLLEKCGPMTLKVSGADATWPPQPSPASTAK